MNLLSVTNLSASYGRVPILSGITFSMHPGEYLGILGHNGMGKTTLLRTLMGTIPATAGHIELEGKDMIRLKTHERSRLGMTLVPQGREIFPALTVRENLAMGLVSSRDRNLAVIDDVLAHFPRLIRLLDRQGSTLSGGEQQLLALARCLCSRPKLVLLDEPTEGIQPSIIEEVIETLLGLKQTWNLSMVIVEQNLDFITALSDRVLGIQKGRITGEVPRSDLLAGHVGIATAIS